MANIQGPVGSNNYTASSRFIDGEGRIYFNKKRFDMPLISFLGMNGRDYKKLESDPIGNTTQQITGKALSKRQVVNAKYTIFTDTVMDGATTVNNSGGYNSSATSVVVADATQFTPFDILLVPRTGERMMVSASNTTTNTLTVTRGWGSTAAAVNNAENVVRVSSAYPVNALSGTTKSTQVQEDYNYTQIFRTPIAMGRTDKDSKLNYSDSSDWERLKMQAAVEHLRAQERALWYGVRNEQAAVDSSGARQRSTGGVFQFVTSNVNDLSASGGVLTQQALDNFAEMVFQYGSGEKIAFCSPRVLSRINSLATNLIRIEPQTEMFGLSLARYVTSHGTLKLVRTPHFSDPGYANQYGGSMVVIDPEQIKYAYLKNGENEWRDNIQENDRDGNKGEWLGECGLHLANEKAHGIMQGIV
jgi:hypothetical protein